MASERTEYLDMIGHVFTTIDKGDDYLVFIRDDGYKIEFYHIQDCCEYVSIEDVCGDLQGLIGKPLRIAEEYTANVEAEREIKYGENQYTFYRFASETDFVTIRWYGESNGYYSIGVSKVDTWNDKKFIDGRLSYSY